MTRLNAKETCFHASDEVEARSLLDSSFTFSPLSLPLNSILNGPSVKQHVFCSPSLNPNDDTSI